MIASPHTLITDNKASSEEMDYCLAFVALFIQTGRCGFIPTTTQLSDHSLLCLSALPLSIITLPLSPPLFLAFHHTAPTLSPSLPSLSILPFLLSLPLFLALSFSPLIALTLSRFLSLPLSHISCCLSLSCSLSYLFHPLSLFCLSLSLSLSLSVERL